MQPTKSGSWPQWPHSFPRARETIPFPVFPLYSQLRAQPGADAGSPKHAGLRWTRSILGDGGTPRGFCANNRAQPERRCARDVRHRRHRSGHWEESGEQPPAKKANQTNPQTNPTKFSSLLNKRSHFFGTSNAWTLLVKMIFRSSKQEQGKICLNVKNLVASFVLESLLPCSHFQGICSDLQSSLTTKM